MIEVELKNELIVPVEKTEPPRRKIGIVVPVLNYFMGLPDLLLSLKTRHEYRVYIQPQYRLQVSLSRAWNAGMVEAFKDGCDYALVCNDDILFAPSTVDSLVSEYERLRPEGVIMTTPNNVLAELNGDRYGILNYSLPPGTVTSFSDHPNFSCFLVSPEYLELVGYFDENFVPAWFEDNDSHRRAKLAGLREITTTASPMVHLGATTTRLMDNPNSGESQRYYIEKWGGIPESHPLEVTKEHFITPYNDASLTIKDWKGNPYV